MQHLTSYEIILKGINTSVSNCEKAYMTSKPSRVKHSVFSFVKIEGTTHF